MECFVRKLPTTQLLLRYKYDKSVTQNMCLTFSKDFDTANSTQFLEMHVRFGIENGEFVNCEYSMNGCRWYFKDKIRKHIVQIYSNKCVCFTLDYFEIDLNGTILSFEPEFTDYWSIQD